MAPKTNARDDLRAGAKGFRTCGEDVDTAVSTLKRETTGTNSPWGGDDLGTVFGGIYQPIADRAFAYYQELGEGIVEIGEALETIAKKWERTEDGAERDVEDAGGG
ncbi:hypothetical protein ABN028_23700 [Actinopolymorpha sp. B17G11]|uniref:WXG100 family type VII secretion target n=1 Tax=unclassified Actinopolymorpha TaxID=2627063 RepID=UPI0032D8C9CB